jgi:glycerate-2-kinase
MKIQNSSALGTTESRKIMLQVAESAYEAIDTKKAIERTCKKEGENFFVLDEEIPSAGRLFLFGVGKCSLEAGKALELIFGNRITDGFFIGTDEGVLTRMTYMQGTHPFPSEQNVYATKCLKEKIVSLKISELDIVLCIISGGGSVLLGDETQMSYQNETFLMKCLFEAGADIKSINTIRKHISELRGGFLAKRVYPAKVISLIFSDVPGNDTSFISSGPTALDKTTKEDAIHISEKYNILNACKLSPDMFLETPKEEKYFARVKNEIIVSNEIALQAMKHTAEKLGFRAEIKSMAFEGEARELGLKMMQEVQFAPNKTVFLYGGESTVTVRHNGKGGRNLELTLSALKEVIENTGIISIASDGHDNCDFAGALCDIISKEKTEQEGLSPDDYLEKNQSYDFFEKTGDFLLTEKTGSNVSDVVAVFKF